VLSEVSRVPLFQPGGVPAAHGRRDGEVICRGRLVTDVGPGASGRGTRGIIWHSCGGPQSETSGTAAKALSALSHRPPLPSPRLPHGGRAPPADLTESLREVDGLLHLLQALGPRGAAAGGGGGGEGVLDVQAVHREHGPDLPALQACPEPSLPPLAQGRSCAFLASVGRPAATQGLCERWGWGFGFVPPIESPKSNRLSQGFIFFGLSIATKALPFAVFPMWSISSLRFHPLFHPFSRNLL